LKKAFTFKQFSINKNRFDMKIGTDGVLLGAWTSLNHKPDSILDIGAGTGLIALMLAQRSSAEVIDALEIDADACEQCVEKLEVGQGTENQGFEGGRQKLRGAWVHYETGTEKSNFRFHGSSKIP
jgi:tRNA1(Val) A37 N6-methylase TrmN6